MYIEKTRMKEHDLKDYTDNNNNCFLCYLYICNVRQR